MNNQEQTINQNETNLSLHDLTVTDEQQAEIKGGPKKIFIGGLSVADEAAPNAPMPQTREHILLARQ